MNALNELHKHMVMRLGLANAKHKRARESFSRGSTDESHVYYLEGVSDGMRHALEMVKAAQSDAARNQENSLKQ